MELVRIMRIGRTELHDGGMVDSDDGLRALRSMEIVSIPSFPSLARKWSGGLGGQLLVPRIRLTTFCWNIQVFWPRCLHPVASHTNLPAKYDRVAAYTGTSYHGYQQPLSDGWEGDISSWISVRMGPSRGWSEIGRSPPNRRPAPEFLWYTLADGERRLGSIPERRRIWNGSGTTATAMGLVFLTILACCYSSRKRSPDCAGIRSAQVGIHLFRSRSGLIH